jgi:AraC-like DNA-binding protein
MHLKKIKIVFLILICLSLITVWIAIDRSNIRHNLLPADQSHFPWQAWVNAGANQGPPAQIDLRESTYNLSVDFTLPGDSLYPYANLGLTWDERLSKPLISWSEYSTIALKVKCRPANTLIFLLYSYEEGISQISDITSHRPSELLISCNENWQEVKLELKALNTLGWWLENHHMDMANQKIHMDKVRGFSIINSFHSPKDVLSSVAIESINLEGRNHFWIYLAIGVVAAIWSVFCFWAIPLLINNNKIEMSNQMVIQQINIDSKHEREKIALLDYLAEAYVNPDLSLEITANLLGINRTKINQILREYTGLTFTAYLNKLRLTEAARLLVEKKMGVAEAAFAVGFGSISYFNRVFKAEYGCAPSSYKSPNAKSDTSI